MRYILFSINHGDEVVFDSKEELLTYMRRGFSEGHIEVIMNGEDDRFLVETREEVEEEITDDMILNEVARMFLVNDLDNWEWSYEDLVQIIVGEYDTDGIEEKVQYINFEKQLELLEQNLRKIIGAYVSLDEMATDEMNDKMIKDLKVEQ